MSLNGGYIMVDCTGLDLIKGTTPQTVNSIYNRVKSAMAYNKPLYACNAIWGTGKPVTPIQCFAIDWGDVIIVTSSTLQIIISPYDSIIINNLAPSN